MSIATTTIETLPTSVQIHIVSFLRPEEGIFLSRCSPSLYRSIAITSLEPIAALPNTQVYGDFLDGDDYQKSQRLSIRMPRVHSLIFSGTWVDQGWGNRKSRLAVVAFPRSALLLERPDKIPNRILGHQPEWGGGRLVYLTPTNASHTRGTFRITLPGPRKDEVYMLYARAGGGGGHSIHVTNASLRTIIFDNEEWSNSKTFKALHMVGFLPQFESNNGNGENHLLFGPQLLASVTRMLLENESMVGTVNNPMCDHVVNLLKQHGFCVTPNGVQSLEEIREAYVAEQELVLSGYNHNDSDGSESDDSSMDEGHF